MSQNGLVKAQAKMTDYGVDALAINAFTDQYRKVESGESGIIDESTIEPLEIDRLADAHVPEEDARKALSETVIIKLNGGLGTSMGLERAKSLLTVRDGLTFLDVIAQQVLAVRSRHQVRLPLLFMNSFRTREDTLAALRRYPELASDLPVDFLQNKVPKLVAEDLTPVTWDTEPALEWCPPGHGDLYTALSATGLINQMIQAGYTQVFVSNSDNLGAVADPRVAGWFAHSRSPFAVEAVRRTASDRKGGHFARRTGDHRIVLRETAQTRPEDLPWLADLTRHRFASTNNLWFNLAAMSSELDARGGTLPLPLIRNVKTVDPRDPQSPTVIQIETAMGAAIELFEDATTIEVGRDRFLPVKTTDDLLVLRSDCYRFDESKVLHQQTDRVPFVELSGAYKLVADFEERFARGAPSLVNASSLVIEGDWSFGSDVTILGDVRLPRGTGHVESGSILNGGHQ